MRWKNLRKIPTGILKRGTTLLAAADLGGSADRADFLLNHAARSVPRFSLRASDCNRVHGRSISDVLWRNLISAARQGVRIARVHIEARRVITPVFGAAFVIHRQGKFRSKQRRLDMPFPASRL